METMDIKDYYKQVIKPRYDKNIEIAKKIFGLDVIGYAYVSHEDGCPMVLDKDEKGYEWVEDNLLSPVWVDTTKERKENPRRTVLGRDVDAMYEVPDYFGNIADAWLIIQKFADKGWDITLHCDDGEQWRCSLGGSDRCTAVAKTAESAICLASMGVCNEI